MFVPFQIRGKSAFNNRRDVTDSSCFAVSLPARRSSCPVPDTRLAAPLEQAKAEKALGITLAVLRVR
jgi:hypothetical protein